jgi:hypothetical protein
MDDSLIPGKVILDAIGKLDDKFEEFRRDVTSWQQETGEKVVKLETIVHPALINNGQPSKISSIDTRVTNLERSKYWMAGVCSSTGALAGIIFELVRKNFGF